MEENLELSSHALEALQSFYAEKYIIEQQLAKMHADAEEHFDEQKENSISMDFFTEDWQLSQFWYSDSTAELLANYLHSAEKFSVCISAPTAFVNYKSMFNDVKSGKCVLLEFDTRFSVFKREYIKYDYHKPLDLSPLIPNSADTILADPPFLSEECLVKTCLTVRRLARKDARIMICTGAIMSEILRKLLPDMKETTFYPQHKGGLANEFRCFTNFEDSNLQIQWINTQQ